MTDYRWTDTDAHEQYLQDRSALTDEQRAVLEARRNRAWEQARKNPYPTETEKQENDNAD